MELGITPTVTAGMVIQLFAGVKLIDVDTSAESERSLLKGAEKCIRILFITSLFFSACNDYLCVLSFRYDMVWKLWNNGINRKR